VTLPTHFYLVPRRRMHEGGGTLVRVGEQWIAFRIPVPKPVERILLGKLRIGGRIILRVNCM
jgi:hypothetical protein